MEDPEGEPMLQEREKKDRASNEMVVLLNNTHRVFWQCVCILIIVGVALISIVASDVYKFSPVGNHILAYCGVSCYLLLLFGMFTCSKDACTRLTLIILSAVFSGLTLGFCFALNIRTIADSV